MNKTARKLAVTTFTECSLYTLETLENMVSLSKFELTASP